MERHSHSKYCDIDLEGFGTPSAVKHWIWGETANPNIANVGFEESRLGKHIPSIQKTLRTQKVIEELFSEGLREIVAIDCMK